MNKISAPLILFSFLGVMVGCIVVSVVIAIKNPVNEDNSYFSSKKMLEQHINQIIKEQNEFDEHYQLYLGANKIPQVNGYTKLSHPFSRTREERVSRIMYLDLSKNNRLYIKPICKKPKKLSISLYVEKINSSYEKIDLGTMKYEDKNSYFVSNALPVLAKGRYKLIVEVNYLRNEEKKRIFFEREIFSI